MPPRVTKKTNPAVALRPLSKVRRSNIHPLDDQDEDMPNSEDTTASPMIANAVELQDSQSSTQSSVVDKNVIDKADNAIQAQKKRHDNAKHTVYKAYTRSVADTKETMASLFEAHEAESSKVHEAHLTRLRQLLKQKTLIEATMQKRVAKLRDAYCAHTVDLQRVIEERARQLE